MRLLKLSSYCLVLFMGTLGAISCIQLPPPKHLPAPSPAPIVKNIDAGTAFDNYKKEIANNYRTLAENTKTGKYKYVAELFDDYKALDLQSRKTCSADINRRVKDAIGADLIDPEKTESLLLQLAKELDP